MAIKAPWLPLPFQRLSQEVERLFEELIYRPWETRRAGVSVWSPQVDLYEAETAVILEVDLPGVKLQEITVAVEHGELVVQGKRVLEQKGTEDTVYRRERPAGQFVRRLRLPASVDQEQIRTEYYDGVLRVTFPKLP
jgi:HSP20 family protein